jgi:hypothetical protein
VNADERGGAPNNLWWVGSLLVVAFIGAIHLPFPFHANHAYFAVVASAIRDGARLYVDAFDLNQPGIFLFYLAAGSSFGFTEAGIHFFELLYWLVFSVVLLVTIGRRMASRVIAGLLPIFTVGAYYLLADPGKLMKAEALSALPIFLAMWFAYRYTTNSNRWLLFASGAAGGIAVSVKLAFAVVLIPIWLLTLFFLIRDRDRAWWKVAGESVSLAVLGALVPISLLAVLLSRWGILNVAVKIAFVYPFRYLSDVPGAPFERLLIGFRWLILGYGPMLVAAAWVVWHSWRVSKDRLVGYLATWSLFGLILHLLQNKAWLAYHLHVATFPVGILAVVAVNQLWVRRTTQAVFRQKLATALSLGVIVMVLSSAVSLVERSVTLASYGFALESDQRSAFQSKYSHGLYRQISDDVEFLRAPGSRPGPIFVAGDPLYYWIAGREHAIAQSGWTLQYYFTAQWRLMAEEIGTAMPVYVFVSREFERVIDRHGSEFAAVLAESYEVLRESETGTWFEPTG